MTISPMKTAHIPAVAELERQCFSSPCSEQGLFEYLNMNGSHFLVAEDGDVLLGYAGLYTVPDEGCITNIAVRPGQRRQGIAKALLSAQIDFCKHIGCRTVTLEVRQSNTAARALYEQLGFAQVGIRPEFYQNPQEAAVLYTKVC